MSVQTKCRAELTSYASSSVVDSRIRLPIWRQLISFTSLIDAPANVVPIGTQLTTNDVINVTAQTNYGRTDNRGFGSMQAVRLFIGASEKEITNAGFTVDQSDSVIVWNKSVGFAFYSAEHYGGCTSYADAMRQFLLFGEYVDISTTNLAACVCVCVRARAQNLTNFCPGALISTPNVPKIWFA